MFANECMECRVSECENKKKPGNQGQSRPSDPLSTLRKVLYYYSVIFNESYFKFQLWISSKNFDRCLKINRWKYFTDLLWISSKKFANKKHTNISMKIYYHQLFKSYLSNFCRFHSNLLAETALFCKTRLIVLDYTKNFNF